MRNSGTLKPEQGMGGVLQCCIAAVHAALSWLQDTCLHTEVVWSTLWITLHSCI